MTEYGWAPQIPDAAMGHVSQHLQLQYPLVPPGWWRDAQKKLHGGTSPSANLFSSAKPPAVEDVFRSLLEVFKRSILQVL